MPGWSPGSGGVLDQLMRIATGSTPDELANEGKTVYPEEVPAGSNREGHRLAARRMTDRMGPGAAQLGGLANEALEDATSRAAGAGGVWDWQDVLANVRGGLDAMQTPSPPKTIGEALMRGFLKGGL